MFSVHKQTKLSTTAITVSAYFLLGFVTLVKKRGKQKEKMIMLPQSEHDRQKAALMEATVKAVAEDGMENLSTREISRRCGVKEVYIYRYFENKDDMVAKPLPSPTNAF